jgi:2-polyprenyl-3-methyl-5-hydroxy-6-metoxy-1,4-benzoquinol methylase
MNLRAIKFYKKYKFNIVETKGSTYIMQRDYNQETEDTADHNYSYGFDFDVMHPYIIQTFAPFFKGNNVLELGSYKGNFTSHLTKYFSDVTCIEASDQAAKLSKARVPNANVICSTFEDSSLDRQFDNVILTHVLEHIDDRVGLLRKIATTWLTDNGRLFVVCPNADAISRQIAVKMGLMDSTTSVTESEFKHGHRVTYNFESLEKDILESGLRVAHKTGIFLKPLANFQMDRVIEQEIVSKQYLDGCYSLGFEFPNLCASIFFLCEKP